MYDNCVVENVVHHDASPLYLCGEVPLMIALAIPVVITCCDASVVIASSSGHYTQKRLVVESAVAQRCSEVVASVARGTSYTADGAPREAGAIAEVTNAALQAETASQAVLSAAARERAIEVR